METTFSLGKVMRRTRPKRKSPSSRLMVTFEAKQRAALRGIAQRSGVSESQIVRLIVDEFLERNAAKTVRFTLTSKDS